MRILRSFDPLASLSILFSVCITLSVVIVACKKTEHSEVTTESASLIRTKFFTVGASTNSSVKAIAASIRKQDGERDFVPLLSRKAGYPIWNKGLISRREIANSDNRLQSEEGGEVILIPFVKENEYTTNAILIVRATDDEDTTYKLVYASQYGNYGFEYEDSTVAYAKNIFHLFTVFDNAIFGYTKFIVKDGRILSGDMSDTTGETLVTLTDGEGTAYENRTISVSFCNA